jgi:TolB protein
MDLESSQVTPLTSGKSTEWFPACSPLGDQVVYWSNAEGNYNLWKVNLDGSNRVQLTFEEDGGLQPSEENLLINAAASWSPDGKKIYYSLNGELWVMDSDGYNPETLLTGKKAFCPFVSLDGSTLYFISNSEDPVYNLWTLNFQDKSLKKLTNYTDWNVGSPSLSADGKKILFNLYRANTSQVYTMNAADGLEPLNLTTNNRSLCPRFAIKDRKILFAAYGSGDDVALNLFLENANGTETKTLTTDGGASPSWAPARILTLASSTPTPAASPAPAKPSTPSVPLPTPVGK